MKRHRIIYLVGSAGTGKTAVATHLACQALANGDVTKITVTRPGVVCGESIGFLPGDLEEKMHPWIMPFHDVLTTMVGVKEAGRLLAEFEVLPIGFVRGRTFSGCVAILDEAQNCTRAQTLAYLTRIGDDPPATIFVCGDPNQSDLPGGCDSFVEFAEELEDAGAAAVIRFSKEMIVRSKLISTIEDCHARIVANENGE